MNLKADYIDLYQIHWPNHAIPIESSWRALEDLLRAGKVRALGVANFAVGDLSELVEVGRPVANQLPYSLLWQAIEFEILALCRERSIGLICYPPLAQGLLSGRYAAAERSSGWPRADAVVFECQTVGRARRAPGCEEVVFRALEGIAGLSRRIGAPMASVALAWVRQQRGVVSLLVGGRNPQELEWNLSSFSLELDAATMADLECLTEPVKDVLGRNPDMWMSKSRMR